MAENNAITESALEAVAWVSYVHSLDGRTDHKVTEEPKWSSEFHRGKYMRRAREIFEVAALHSIVEDTEGDFDEERLITSADVNNASAAKAYELWGGKN